MSRRTSCSVRSQSDEESCHNITRSFVVLGHQSPDQSMFRPDLAHLSVPLEHEDRRPTEETLHLLMHIFNRDLPDLRFELVQFDSPVALDLSYSLPTLRVSSSSLSLCFSVFMKIPARRMFLARSSSSSGIGSFNIDISLSPTRTNSSACKSTNAYIFTVSFGGESK